MRLAGKRPPSTAGNSASITARTRPSAISPVRSVSGVGPAAATLALPLRFALAMRFVTQDDRRKRRQVEIDRL